MTPIYTFGFTLFYLGSGAILLAMVKGVPPNRATEALATIGTFSYSIYLFHAAVGAWLVPQATWLHVICYFVFSVAIGAWISKFIEIPMLKLRETLLAAE